MPSVQTPSFPCVEPATESTAPFTGESDAELSAHDLSALFEQGVAFHQQGELVLAEQVYQQILRHQPLHFDALHMLGVIAAQCCQSHIAAELIGQALQIQPRHALAHNNRGNALLGLQRYDEALVCYEQASALKPDHVDAHSNRGIALHALGRFSEALASFDAAIELKPSHVDAHFNQGISLKELQRFDEALISFETTLALKPEHLEAQLNRCAVLRELHRIEEVLNGFDQAIALNPEHVEAIFNRAIALQDLRRFADALESCDLVIAKSPEHIGALVSRGNALLALNRFDEALASYDQAIALNPQIANIHSNRGVLFQDLLRYDDALACYDNALAIEPEHVDAHWNKSIIWLLRGDLLLGWDLYEWRSKKKEFQKPNFTQPLWLGDILQFCRYAQQVQHLGAKVILSVPGILMPLMAGLKGVDHLIETGHPLPPFDCHCSLMSLPWAFKTQPTTVPCSRAYLSSDPNKVQEWRHRLGPKTRPRIGLAWSGNAHHHNDRNRSMALADWLPYLPTDFDYVSLQKEVRAADQDTLADSPIRHFGDDIQDFSDTAALCELVDLVVSVDTSVVHLAGAMGKTTWVLLPYEPDWRWMLQREDSPWYDSVRLYRQSQKRSWQPVLERVASDLCASLSGRQSDLF